MAEPYDLEAVDLADLAYLLAEGFTISVSTQGARHLPGRTLAVFIEVKR